MNTAKMTLQQQQSGMQSQTTPFEVLKVKVYPVINNVILKVEYFLIAADRPYRKIARSVEARITTEEKEAPGRTVEKIRVARNIKRRTR